MKKLSKIFAVVLVLAMALSILPMGAGAVAANAGATATVVTDVANLAVGDQVVIVAKESNAAMGTTQNSNNRAKVDITKNGNQVTLTDDVEVLTLKAGTTAGTFAFDTGEGYLYAASSSKNYLRTQTTLDANGSFEITIAASGVATIKAKGTNTRNWLRFNSTNNPPIFACYGSGQADVCIYKLDAAVQDTREELPTASGAVVDAIFALQSGETLSKYYKYDGDITLEGVVAGNASWSDSYNNGTVNFKVKDSNNAEKTMQAYKLVPGTGLTADDVKNLTTGDTVTIKGSVVKNFNGTYEFDGCELVSVTKGQVTLPALPTETNDVVDAIFDLAAGETLDMYYDYEDFTLSGTIVGETSWSDQYSNGELTIKIDGTEKELLAYRFEAGTVKLDVVKALAAGDKVTFKVESVKNYNGTHEMEYPVLTAVEKAPEKEPDKVGDNTAIVAMTSVMAIAVVALAVLVIGKKRMF